MEQKQEKLYALLNEKLDHTEEISDEEILVEIDKLIWEEAKGQESGASEACIQRVAAGTETGWEDPEF